MIDSFLSWLKKSKRLALILLIICLAISYSATYLFKDKYISEVLLAPNETLNSPDSLDSFDPLEFIGFGTAGSFSGQTNTHLEILKTNKFLISFLNSNEKLRDDLNSTFEFFAFGNKKNTLEDIASMMRNNISISKNIESNTIKIALKTSDSELSKLALSYLIDYFNDYLLKRDLSKDDIYIQDLRKILNDSKYIDMRDVVLRLLEKSLANNILKTGKNFYYFETLDPAKANIKYFPSKKNFLILGIMVWTLILILSFLLHRRMS